MSNKRKRYRENKKKAKREEWLERKNIHGFTDLTPFDAVLSIIEKENKSNKKKRRGES